MELQQRMQRFLAADLYVAITESFCGGRSALEVLDACLDAGVSLIQMREKDRSSADLYRLGCAFRDRTRAAGALLIINDRIDIALAVEADGVHLGQEDLPLVAARTIAPNLILGASSSGLDQALAAQEAGADYVNIGPIYATDTKHVASGAVGPEIIGVMRPRLRIPLTCMGGIKSHNVHEVLEQGIRHVAVVTAVTAADDIRGAAKTMREQINAARGARL